MSAGSDLGLLGLTISAWQQFLQDYKKNKEVEDAVKEQERKTQEYLDAKKGQSKGVLDRLNAATDSGLVEHIMSTWAAQFAEDKKAKEMEDLLNGGDSKFRSFNDRQKGNAQGVMGRVSEQIQINCILRCLMAWATDTKCERIVHFYNKKMDSKQSQLSSVQGMFKNFATQLDSGMKGDDSNRDHAARKKPGMSKSDNSTSLPDIRNR